MRRNTVPINPVTPSKISSERISIGRGGTDVASSRRRRLRSSQSDGSNATVVVAAADISIPMMTPQTTCFVVDDIGTWNQLREGWCIATRSDRRDVA